MNDCIHALHRRLDRHLISDIANQNFYTLREHARCRSIERKGTDMETCLIQRMDGTTEIGESGHSFNAFSIDQVKQFDRSRTGLLPA